MWRSCGDGVHVQHIRVDEDGLRERESGPYRYLRIPPGCNKHFKRSTRFKKEGLVVFNVDVGRERLHG